MPRTDLDTNIPGCDDAEARRTDRPAEPRETLDPIVIVGAGPVGLAAALRLASLGIPTTLLDDKAGLRRAGSRALCIQHGVLQIMDVVGCAQELLAEGVPWSISRTFVRDVELLRSHFTTAPHDPLPPFLNISQRRTEEILLEHVRRTGRVTELWSHAVEGVDQDADRVFLTIQTPAGKRRLSCQYLVGCDGLHSAVRRSLSVPWAGYSHSDRFLIVDVRTAANIPRERRFYFDAPSNPGRQIVVHPQPDGMWRFDWQLPPDASLESELQTGKLEDRIRALIGDADFEIDWASSYRFHQRAAARMRVGRVFLAGDAAHALPPFGARGMNSGIQDADNLAWKLASVLRGHSRPALLETYHAERHAAARENLAITESTIRFMVPPTRLHRWLRDAILHLSRRHPRLRGFVNSGQMSRPTAYTASPIIERPASRRRGRANEHAGRVVTDFPCMVDGRVVRLRHLARDRLIGLYFCVDPARAATMSEGVAASVCGRVPFQFCVVPPVGLRLDRLPAEVMVVDDFTGAIHGRYATDGACFYLIRPDGYVAAHRREPGPAEIAELITRSTSAAADDSLPELTTSFPELKTR